MPKSEQHSVLAFDYGLKNIGVAGCYLALPTATELPALKARDGVPNWDEVERLLQTREASLALIGLPLNMDGTESALCVRARKFANRLHGRFGIAIELVDERLSTAEAKTIAAERGHRGHYASDPVDSIAARIILETWLNQRTH